MKQQLQGLLLTAAQAIILSVFIIIAIVVEFRIAVKQNPALKEVQRTLQEQLEPYKD